MPTAYKAPGVYVEEAPPTARPIAGVGTSTAGFIGVVEETVIMPFRTGSVSDRQTVAPAGEPQLITSWEEFKNNFGDLIPDNKDLQQKVLAHAVYGFFNNGGTRCWVLRVAQATDLTNLSEELPKFATIDEIAIMAVPGATEPAQQNALIDHCTNLKDRVAILDGVQSPATLTSEAIRGGTQESSHAALYFPWIKVADPASTAIILQPPSGHIAGVYARVDATRGVFKAPANEPIRGALDLERRISTGQQEELNVHRVNAIRSFSGNLKIWGARTLGGDANQEFKYISTRRYFNFLRESIDEGTQFAVFEPNTPSLWQQITRNVSDFLLGQWRDGALFGEKPEQAFFVRCDAETNPADVRERGQVVTEIGVAIVKPAEFVIFRVQQTTGG
jgi:uncharacterized protein